MLRLTALMRSPTPPDVRFSPLLVCPVPSVVKSNVTGAAATGAANRQTPVTNADNRPHPDMLLFLID